MSLSLIILLTILIIFIICFIYIEPIISKHKIKNNNEYGSARFSTFNEINKNFTKEKIRKKHGKKTLRILVVYSFQLSMVPLDFLHLMK